MLNPSEEWGTILFDGLEGIPSEDIHIHLFERTGFWNKLFNRMQWEVTIKAPEMNATIMIDAHNGEFINLVGAFS